MVRDPVSGDSIYEILDLGAGADLSRLNHGAGPLLDDHGTSNRAVIGLVQSARVEGHSVIAVVTFGTDPDSDALFRKVSAGTLRNVSIGYRVIGRANEGVAADGRPVIRVTQWEAFEISVTPVGADGACQFRSAVSSSLAVPEVHMPEVDAVVTPEPAVVATPVVDPKIAETAILSERSRISDIQAACAAGKRDAAFVAQHIQAGTPVDQVRKLVLDALASEGGKEISNHAPMVEAGESALEKMGRGMSAWLLERSGRSEQVVAAAVQNPKRFGKIETDGGEFRGLTLMELAREYLTAAGVQVRGLAKDALATRALSHRSSNSGYQTTSDFPVLLANVMHKILLGAYEYETETWPMFCKTMDLPDFRDSNLYRTGAMGVLDPVSESGEFLYKTRPDGEALAVNVTSWGDIIGISRKVMVNDDMGALTNDATQLGQAAAYSIEAAVYGLLALNAGLGPTIAAASPFFDYTLRGNVNNVASALTVAGLEADRLIMRKQKDPASKRILGLQPSILLVAAGYEGIAKVINTSVYDPDATNQLQVPNRALGYFGTIVDSPLMTGTRRYLFADPSRCAAIVVAFLAGSGRAPQMATEYGFEVDGVKVRVSMDFKAQVHDPRGAVTNAGA
jgi:hypothetical protein